MQRAPRSLTIAHGDGTDQTVVHATGDLGGVTVDATVVVTPADPVPYLKVCREPLPPEPRTDLQWHAVVTPT